MEDGRRKSKTTTNQPHRRRRQEAAAAASTDRCRRHPKHRQPPGVCSLCLRERLSRLSTAQMTRLGRTAAAAASSNCSYSSSSTSSSLYSSYASTSACSSPVPFSAPFAFLRSGRKSKSNIIGVTKSRSVAFGAAEASNKKKNKNKIGRLWSKLLRQWRSDDNDTKEKRDGYRDVLVYTRTMTANNIASGTDRIR